MASFLRRYEAKSRGSEPACPTITRLPNDDAEVERTPFRSPWRGCAARAAVAICGSNTAEAGRPPEPDEKGRNPAIST